MKSYMETLKLYAKIGDYESTLKFVQDELMEDRKKLAEIRKNPNADPRSLESLQNEIHLFEQAVDEYQSKIKILKQNVETICNA